MTKKQKRNTIISIIVVIVVLIGASIILRSVLQQEVQNNTTYTVKKETYRNVISVSGNIEAAQQQNLAASGSGTITNVYVQQGDVVKAGQVLIQLDNLNETYALANQDYQIQQQRIAGSKQQVTLLEKQRQVLQRNLENRTVKALYDGIVAVLSCSTGDVVVAQTELGTVIDRTYLKASVEVVETDAAQLQIGQKVTLAFPAYPESVEGYVESFPAAGRITSRGATVVDAIIRIDNPPPALFTAYSFTGEIEITEPETLLLLERQAIGYEQGNPFVELIKKDGSAVKQSITIIPYNTSYVRITEGLTESDNVKAQSVAQTSGSKTGNMGAMGGAPQGGTFSSPPAGAPSGAAPTGASMR